MATRAEVWIWGVKAGVVSWNDAQGLGTGVFEFDGEFAATGLEIAPIWMRTIAGKAYAFPSLSPQSFKALPPCLSDSLPDSFGNAVIDAWLTSSGRDPADLNPVERLLCVGSRGMGALEFKPAFPQETPNQNRLHLDALVMLTDLILRSTRSSLALTKIQRGTLGQLFLIGSSAGGQRPKVIVAFNESTEEIRPNEASEEPGFNPWLMKLDLAAAAETSSALAGFGRVEYAYYLMARAAGLTMTDCRLHLEGRRAHFMTRRFDRTPNGEKLHVQTLCAMDHADFTKPGAYSYERALQLCQRLKLSRIGQIEFFRRAVFNVVARNQDDHTRNTAFFMGRDGIWHLAPAYDICWAYRADSQWVSRHQMSINGKRDGFTLDDLLTLARLIPDFDPEGIIKTVVASVRCWQVWASQAGIKDEVLVKQIGRTHRMYLAGAS